MPLSLVHKKDVSIENIYTQLKLQPQLGFLKPKNKNNSSYKKFLEDSTLNLYNESKNYILFPRYITDNLSVPELTSSAPAVVSCFFNKEVTPAWPLPEGEYKKITLRQGDQYNCFKLITDNCKLNDEYSGIVHLSTSTGKTVLAIAIAKELNLKTLVFVNTEQLLNQWVDRIKQFLPNCRVGIIQGKVFDSVDKDIVIGTVQTISYSKKIGIADLKQFNLVFIDEVHSVSTQVFSQIFFKITAKYQFGLSATIDRADTLDKVFRSFLGPVIYSNADTSKKQETLVIINKSSIDFGEMAYTKLFGEEKPNISQLINKLAVSTERNKIIAREIIKLLTPADCSRKILVMSGRISQLNYLDTTLKAAGVSCGLFLGKMRKAELEETRKCRVILATYQMVKQGFDQPDINTLVFATPISDIEQAIGRIYRKHHEQTPIIIDILDENYTLFVNQCKRRIALYRSKIENPQIVYKNN